MCGRKTTIATIMKICITSVVLVVFAAGLAQGTTSRLVTDDPSSSQERPSCSAPSPMVISNSSATYDWWRSPPPSAQPLLRVYIYNYTNVETFGPENEKLRVQEVGPFTYREITEKVQIVFHNDSTVSYREKKSYEFLPEMSAHPEDTRLVVPNTVFMTVLAASRDQAPEARAAANIFLRALKQTPFLGVSVRSLLFGYDDKVVNLMNLIGGSGSSKMSLLEEGVSKVKVTVHTGVGDSCRLGQVVGVDVKAVDLRLRTSGSDECHRVDGSPDGRQFPPALVAMNGASRLHLYTPGLCRRLPLQRDNNNDASSAVAHRYRTPVNVFDGPTRNPENRCFCPHDDSAECMPSGVINASACVSGAPIVVSLPHFLYGDASLRSDLLGLQPDPEKHHTVVDVDPALGVAVGGAFRLQLNLQLRKAAGIMDATLRPFKDLSILPLVWLENSYTRDHLPTTVLA